MEEQENHRKNCGKSRIKHPQGEKEANFLFWHSTLKSENEDALILRSEILKPRNIYHRLTMDQFITMNRNE